MGDTHTKKPAAPEGYFLIPRLLAYTLTGLAVYISIALTVLAIGVWVGLGTDSGQDTRLKTLARQTRHVAVQNQTALCGLRGDLEQRVDSSRNFLREHPGGLPDLGITAAAIREGVRNQSRTIGVLEVLDCP
jgi:hypothetical protein